MVNGPTFADSCPQRRSEPEWPDVEKLVARIEKRNKDLKIGWWPLHTKEWRQIKSLLERVK